MPRNTKVVAFAILLAALAAHTASAQQISDALRVSQHGMLFNAHALGMGNAYSTIGYDVSALRFNPATMAVSPTFSWTASAEALGFKSRTDYYGNNTDFKTSNITSGQLGLTLPVRVRPARTVILGFSYNRSKDFGSGLKYSGFNDASRYPTFPSVLENEPNLTARALGLTFPTYDASNNYLGDKTILSSNLAEKGYQLAGGDLTHYSFGASMEATHNFFVGASGSYISGRYTSDVQLSAVDVNDFYPTGVLTSPGDPRTSGFVSADYHAVRDRKYEGWDGRFGALWKLANLVGISGSIHLPASQKVSENFFTGGISHFAGNTSIVAPDIKTVTTYRFQPPAEVTAGGMVNLWIVTGTLEATYVDYTALRLTEGPGTDPERTLLNKKINDEMAPVINYNLGTEVRLPWTGVSGRGGFLYEPSPFRYDPGRLTKRAITLGAGYDANHVAQVDLGYAYTWYGEATARDVVEGASADQRLSTNTLLFTIRVGF